VTRPLVIKLGGELLEGEAGWVGVDTVDNPGRVVVRSGKDRIEHAALADVVAGIAAIAATQALVIVHGGGREIDAALNAAGLQKRQVDGLRITDDATLRVVVSVLAGAVNTRLVAALIASGVAAVGLTGADGACGLSTAAPPHRAVDGRVIDLGRVGVPEADSDTRLLETLLGAGYVPVVASIGVGRTGQLLNVNADTMAGHMSAVLRARRLVVAGTTAGVLGADGRTVPLLDAGAVTNLVNDRTVTAGMVAKLRACERALSAGVDDVVIVDGRDGTALVRAAGGVPPHGATRLVRMVPA
jgi:acetylglutamate kinase